MMTPIRALQKSSAKHFIGFRDFLVNLKQKKFSLSASNLAKCRTGQEFELSIENYEKTMATV
jgi:hypothetical protein